MSAEARRIIARARKFLLEEGWSRDKRREDNGGLVSRCMLGALWDAACEGGHLPPPAYGESCSLVAAAIGRRTGEENPSIARFNSLRWTTVLDVVEVLEEAESE